MNSVLLLGITVFLGTLSGKIFQKCKVPQVTGYILLGLILGRSVMNLWTPAMVEAATPLVKITLGIVGFMLGGELKMDVFRNRGRSIYSILFAQGFMTFLVVFGIVQLVTGKFYMAVLLGAIATATDPAATASVLWENKTRGPLTTSLLAIVALDDVLALIIYAFAAITAKSLLAQNAFSFDMLLHALNEIGLGLVIGVCGGIVLYALIHFVQDRERILPFSIGVVALIVGAAAHFHVDLILASMIASLTLTNMAPVESEEIFSAIKKFSMPFYVVFFVIVGARLDIHAVLEAGAGTLLLWYIAGRMIGKTGGSYLGGVIGRAPRAVSRYLGIGLFSQAGVAIGMAISINHSLAQMGPEAAQVGHLVVNIAVATTFVFQVIGPSCVRLAASRAGELWKNVTEEDIIGSYKVSDLVEKDVPVIKENTPLHTMVELIKNSESYDFCVVDHAGRLLGSISIGDLRDVLLDQGMGLNELVLAKDIAVPSQRIIGANRPLKEAIEILRRKDLTFLPVVKDENSRELAGIIHYRHAMSEVNKQLLARRG